MERTVGIIEVFLCFDLSLFLDRWWFTTNFNLDYSAPAGKPLSGESVDKVPLSLRVQGIVPHSRMLAP